MEPLSDVKIEGHLKGIYEETVSKMFFDSQDRLQTLWLKVVSTTISVPTFDFSQRDVYIICNNLNSTSSNYIALVYSRRDPKTKELYAYCCNVVEVDGGTVMGKCKLVLSVNKKEKLNIVWLPQTSPHLLDPTLAAYAAKQKYLNDQFSFINTIVSRTQSLDFRCDMTDEDVKAQQLKDEMRELNETIREARVPVKERLAGRLLN